MTDTSMVPPAATFRSVDFSSDEALARVKKRYRTEARFRLYGLLAVLFAGVFVFVLLADIVRKGWPAFFEHRVTLSLTLDAKTIDPEGQRDPAVLRNADYQKIVLDSLRATFPDVRDRRDRRRLEALVSTGAGDDVRAAVLRSPDLIGQTVRFPVVLADDADLHLKGLVSPVLTQAGGQPVDLKVTGKNAELTATTPVFAALLAETKAGLRQQAERLSIELARLPQAAGEAGSALETRRADLTRRVDDLRRRAAAAEAAEVMDPSTMPSRIIRGGGAYILIKEVALQSAKGVVLVAPATMPARLEQWDRLTFQTPESNRKANDSDLAWLEALRDRGQIEKAFATRFFTGGDSREPELAGIRGALVGSALTLLVTLIVCLPLGVGAAVYLEEFAPKNRFTDILEVNINNLAAVPSIVFGLLGLAMFLNFFGLPRSAPLVGGLVLALLVLPTIIIASRAALKAVPPSIKEAALGVGASHQQAIFHHVLPLAMPGIMTGTIIGMAHALGETAPLLMIGMVAFIVDIPQAVTDPGTVLPVQIYLWSDLPEVAFQAKTAGAIMVLLGFLFVMNGAAILLRRRFERRW